MTDDRDEHLSKLNASDDHQSPESAADPRASQSEGGSSRRRFVKAGLTAVPIIFTLRSRSAWGDDTVENATNLTGQRYIANVTSSGDDSFSSLGNEPEQTGFLQDPWADDESGGGEDGDGFC